jgi:methionyl aminopeptidase
MENEFNKQAILKAGEISKQVKEYAKSFIKKDMLLLEIAEKIEEKIFELGGEPAFPTNLSINEIAAHYTPSYDDETKASGLLKIDLGVHVEGWIADTAFSLDLEDLEENKKLIQASKDAVDAAEKILSEKTTLSEIGTTIENTITKHGFTPISNLTGHSLEEYNLHAGLTIPNIKNNSEYEIGEGLFAIEPFATTGIGKIHDGKPSGIYQLQDEKNVRSPIAREILEYIINYYSTLPFCSRWLVQEFGTSALVALRQLEQNGNLYQFSQLIESSKAKVSQTENTFFIEKGKVIKTSE